MGPTPRGGAYTYDWIDNVLGLGMHSVDQVLPEYQHPQIGDAIALGSNRMRIEQVVPEHASPRGRTTATGSGHSWSRSETGGHVSSAATGSDFRR